MFSAIYRVQFSAISCNIVLQQELQQVRERGREGEREGGGEGQREGGWGAKNVFGGGGYTWRGEMGGGFLVWRSNGHT